jgi:6-pyruvoyltetrahydropterin/6-carboxytetrahydropterin synthase
MSMAFRQWAAPSHCRFLHGYSIAIKFTFEAEELDYRNWVVDFGDLKELKQTIQDFFDHKTVIAEDDPHLDYFKRGDELGVLELVVVPAVGVEKFAEFIFGLTTEWMEAKGYSPRCCLVSVEVNEHEGNSAIAIEEQ